MKLLVVVQFSIILFRSEDFGLLKSSAVHLLQYGTVGGSRTIRPKRTLRALI